MKIQVRIDPDAGATVDALELRERAHVWLKRMRELIKVVVVRIRDAVASLHANDRLCEIEAQLANGMRLTIHARGRGANVAFERALRRLAHAVQSSQRRDDAVRHFRALAAGA